jgi:hypothetical protein
MRAQHLRPSTTTWRRGIKSDHREPLAGDYSRAECRCRRRFELEYGHALAVASWKYDRVRQSSKSKGGCNAGPAATPNGRARIIGRLVTGCLVMGRLGIVVKARGSRTGLEAVRNGRHQMQAISPDIGGATATMGLGIADPPPAAAKEIACSWAGRLDGRLSNTDLFHPRLREHRLGLIGPSRLARGPTSRDESHDQDQKTGAAHCSLRKANQANC